MGIHLDSASLASDVGNGGNWNESGAGSGGHERSSFPSLWPFGGGEGEGYDRNHFRGAKKAANIDELQSSDESDSDEDVNEFGGERQEGAGYSGKRRLSVTTEAKRRTSLEDDDEDEETVHVAMVEADAEEAEKGKVVEGEGEGDDGELVEIQHSEMQGVEGK